MDNKEIAFNVVSKVTGVAKSTILSRTRRWPAVEARQLFVLLLSRDGANDMTISWMLNRGRCAILQSRHNAIAALKYSKLFRDKFDKISEQYELQKSLRVS